MSFLDAAAVVDFTDIYNMIIIDIPKSVLRQEINDLLFTAKIQLVEFEIQNFDILKKYSQNSDIETIYCSKRNPKFSEIDPNKLISEHFSLIWVNDPTR